MSVIVAVLVNWPQIRAHWPQREKVVTPKPEPGLHMLGERTFDVKLQDAISMAIFGVFDGWHDGLPRKWF